MLLLLPMVLASCSPNMEDGLGPRVPLPTVTGAVTRDGAVASSARVELRDPITSARIQSTLTSATGDYGLVAHPGSWEVRVSGSMPGDFASVTREFSTSNGTAHLAPMDLFAYDAALLSPANNATAVRPSVAAPAGFRWRPPGRPVRNSRVQLYDSTGTAVWYSDPTGDSTASWDGTFNQGALSGSAAGPGRYQWRVKFSFPDSSEGRTERWGIVLP